MAENGPKKNAAIEWLRGLVSQIPESPNTLSILNMLRAGSNTALNWLDATNRAIQGYDPRGALEQGDLLAPLGVGAMVAPFSPRGAVGVFGGKLAKTADLDALAKAEALEAAGAPRERIWDETGWFRGADGKWRFEIPDVDMRVRLGRGRLADIVHHPALFEAYPELADIPMKSTVWPIIPAGGAGPGGLFAGGLGKDMRRWVTAHEIQHAIQDIEGFSPGAHPDVVGWDTYQRAAGEVEAVNVGRRSTAYDPQILREEPPWKTQPIPEEEQIIRGPADEVRERRDRKRYDTGGAVKTGPLISDVPGRTDKHPIDVPEGAYVIPADIVSGLGEGNTLAGMRILENLFPKPLKAGKIRRHSEVPAPRNRGGLVPIAAAGGEYIIDPETVAEIGGGDINRGHQVLDEFVLRARKNIIQQMASLPPPQK